MADIAITHPGRRKSSYATASKEPSYATASGNLRRTRMNSSLSNTKKKKQQQS